MRRKGVCLSREFPLPSHGPKRDLAIYYKERRDRFISAGLCGHCGKEKINYERSKQLGTLCLDDNRRRRAEWWQRRSPEQEIKTNKQGQEYRGRLKKAVFDHYGWHCACCNEGQIQFLELDHIGGGGNQHRREIGRGQGTLYAWAIREAFPAMMQTLCANCNRGRFLNKGVCPHQDPKNSSYLGPK